MGDILLIEDNMGHAQLIIMGLKSSGMDIAVNHVENGVDAMNYLRKKGKFSAIARLPSLILLDLRMPKMDGLEVLKEIKSDPALDAIPVIILTTSESEKDLAKAYQNHANGYLVKPDSFEEMSAMLKVTADYWLEINRRAN